MLITLVRRPHCWNNHFNELNKLGIVPAYFRATIFSGSKVNGFPDDGKGEGETSTIWKSIFHILNWGERDLLVF